MDPSCIIFILRASDRAILYLNPKVMKIETIWGFGAKLFPGLVPQRAESYLTRYDSRIMNVNQAYVKHLSTSRM